MTNARILVVEDESIVALDLQDRLQEIGYAVPAVARTGEQAIEKARDLRPDLILMDINLAGEIDGIQAARQIRDAADIPVIFLTAFSDESTLERARAAGPYGYILKPFVVENIHTAIEMALHRHKLEIQLRESERRYRRLYEQSNDAIFIHSLAGRIQDVNGRACTMLRREREALLRMEIQSLHPEDEQPAVQDALRSLSEKGAAQYESRLTRADGSQIHVDISNSVFDRERGMVQAIVRDITARVRAEQALRAQKVELEARNEELNAFAHTVAHDLKSPLGLVIGYAKLLNEHAGAELDEIMAKSIGVILRQGTKMVHIIDALLLLAGVRDVEVEPEPVNMGDIVNEALARLQPMIHESQAEIVPPAAWPAAMGYPLWVEEIWVNYLSNAIKYGGRPPRLELGAEILPGHSAGEPGTGGRMVRFWVKDNGPGLSPEEQTRLFTSFTRLHQVRAAGHGLGLSIVQRISKKLGGRAEVTSSGVPGQGSTFSFTLPMAQGASGIIERDGARATGKPEAARSPR